MSAPKNRKMQEKKPQKELTADEKKLEMEKRRKAADTQYKPFESKRKWNSRFAEYQVAQWRFVKQNLYVTMDTIVPNMPKKPLEEPDDSKYHLQIAEIDEQIEQMNESFKEKKANKWEKRSKMVDG